MWNNRCHAMRPLAKVFCQAVIIALAAISSVCMNASIADGRSATDQSHPSSEQASAHSRTVHAETVKKGAHALQTGATRGHGPAVAGTVETVEHTLEARPIPYTGGQVRTAPVVQQFVGPSSALAPGAPRYTGPSYTGPRYTGPSYTGKSRAGPSYEGKNRLGPSYAGKSRLGPSYAGRSRTGPSYTGPSYTGPAH
jgi:hypothetical protein